jgi:hypothetical protein
MCILLGAQAVIDWGFFDIELKDIIKALNHDSSTSYDLSSQAHEMTRNINRILVRVRACQRRKI